MPNVQCPIFNVLRDAPIFFKKYIFGEYVIRKSIFLENTFSKNCIFVKK